MRWLCLILLLVISACEGPVGPAYEPIVVVESFGAEDVDMGFSVAVITLEVEQITEVVVSSGSVIAQFQTPFLESRSEWVSLPFNIMIGGVDYDYTFRYGVGNFQLHISTDSPPLSKSDILTGRIKLTLL